MWEKIFFLEKFEMKNIESMFMIWEGDFWVGFCEVGVLCFDGKCWE